MAVTVASNPPVSPNVISVSYPAIIELTSTIYGTANVTQFRYVAEVTAGGSAIGTKYTVPVDPTASNGFFDVSELFKLAIKLGHLAYGKTTEITKESWALAQTEDSNVVFTVQIKEQYYLSGVFTTNTGSLLTFVAGRGWTNRTNDIWGIVNWWQYNGLGNFIPYSGLSRIMIAIRTDDPSWTATGTNPYMNIKRTWKNVSGGTKQVDNWEFDRTAAGYLDVVFCPLYKSGQSDDADYGSVELILSTRPSIGGADTVEETLEIYKNINTCVDEEAVVMFRDRFFQWSFMSFIKKQNTTVNTRPQQAESIDGRFRYNVKSDEVLTLNTDWMPDAVNEMFKDLVATEQCYLLAADGSLEALTVEPNSLRLQTSRNDGLHQYQMSFRKSIDNFRA
jgi:hypothetical protein